MPQLFYVVIYVKFSIHYLARDKKINKWKIATFYNDIFSLICQRVRQCQTDLDLWRTTSESWSSNEDITLRFLVFSCLSSIDISKRGATADLFYWLFDGQVWKMCHCNFMRKMSHFPQSFLLLFIWSMFLFLFR